MDWDEILAGLTAELEVLAAQGVTFLNIAPHETFPPMAPGLPDPAAPGGKAGAKSRPGRATGILAALQGAPPPTAPAAASAAPPQGGEKVGLANLEAEFAACERCKLCQGRQRVVFGTGHGAPPLLFIGEGPGAEEDAQGLPFVGQAGRLLTGLIVALGLTREDVYITNVVKCRPPGNRTPEPDEVAACRPILERQMELLNPGLIVTLGNVPLKALRPAAGGITRERGIPFAYQNHPVLPTFHPSYLLRNPAAIGDCWRDFRKAFSLAYPEPAP